MINHHPHDSLLLAHANGELALSMSIAISAHCELCEQCQTALTAYTEQAARAAFHLAPMSSFSAFPPKTDNDNAASRGASARAQAPSIPAPLEHMLEHIFAQPTLSEAPSNKPISIKLKKQEYYLPAAFKKLHNRPWQQLGKASRMRCDLDEMNTRASLLHIEPLGEIPEHTHKGYELTLLLAGEFSDSNGNYVAGDFIMLDATTEHAPTTTSGCLCYTVLNAPLHFTKGLSKLLNPIGELIY